MLTGHVDSVVGGIICGWIVDLKLPHESLNIAIYDSKLQLVATGIADGLRVDLEQFGYSAHHGFELPLNYENSETGLYDIEFILNVDSGEILSLNRRSGEAGISDVDILFPKSLSVSPPSIKNALVIGSCLSEDLVRLLNGVSLLGCHYHHVLANNASSLPDAPPCPGAEIDIQIIQIPIRHVLSDVFIDAKKLRSLDAAEYLRKCKGFISAFLESALQYYHEYGILTCVMSFALPTGSSAISLQEMGEFPDILYITTILNEYLTSIVRDMQNVFVIDSDRIASVIGRRYVSDDLICFGTHGGLLQEVRSAFEPHSQNDLDGYSLLRNKPAEYARAVEAACEYCFRISNQIDSVKLVIFDLDNTLWRGLIAQDYDPQAEQMPANDGWPMGVWDAIQQLRARGILVAICSKNDEQVVRGRWDMVVNPPFISLDDFVDVRINWKPKPDNIAEIIKKCSLTEKSVVFVDDNPLERAEVMARFPKIRCIGANPLLTRLILLRSSETQVLQVTGESGNRERAIKDRKVLSSESSLDDRASFLLDLGLKVYVRRLCYDMEEINRCFELLNKTNQFNSTGVRWKWPEFQGFVETSKVYFFSAMDRYVDHGIVGLLLISGCHIKQVVMSCRVIGLGIEFSVINAVMESNGGAHQKWTAEFCPTESNGPVREFFPESGFVFNQDESCYVFDSGSLISAPKHVNLAVGEM